MLMKNTASAPRENVWKFQAILVVLVIRILTIKCLKFVDSLDAPVDLDLGEDCHYSPS